MDGRALFAWNLRRLRTERGISQARLASESNIDRAYLSELERKDANPTLDFLDRLGKCLNVPLHEFFREPKQGEKRPRSLPGGRPRLS